MQCPEKACAKILRLLVFWPAPFWRCRVNTSQPTGSASHGRPEPRAQPKSLPDHDRRRHSGRRKHRIQDHIFRIMAAFEVNCHIRNSACSFLANIWQIQSYTETAQNFATEPFQIYVNSSIEIWKGIVYSSHFWITQQTMLVEMVVEICPIPHVQRFGGQFRPPNLPYKY